MPIHKRFNANCFTGPYKFNINILWGFGYTTISRLQVYAKTFIIMYKLLCLKFIFDVLLEVHISCIISLILGAQFIVDIGAVA